jgi:hypothetical protein
LDRGPCPRKSFYDAGTVALISLEIVLSTFEVVTEVTT